MGSLLWVNCTRLFEKKQTTTTNNPHPPNKQQQNSRESLGSMWSDTILFSVDTVDGANICILMNTFTF